MKNIHSIAKENLKATHFYKSDVLSNFADRQQRQYELHRAMLLGNIYHNHTNIIFMTADGSLQQVEATIWSISEDHILLKGGVYIPVRAVVALDY